MTTRTFERKLIIQDETSIEKFVDIVMAESSGKPFLKRPQTEESRRKSEELLNDHRLKAGGLYCD